jgi:hypothetical protein
VCNTALAVIVFVLGRRRYTVHPASGSVLGMSIKVNSVIVDTFYLYAFIM